ncbi:MAG: hypothetical protein ACFFFG_05340 [Candidatus Thorarchaeota archaeon]
MDIPIDDNLEFLMENEMVSEILWTLAFYKSSNLKKISEIINKKPASVLYNLKRLEKRNLIQLDAQATQKRKGKYYNVSSKGYELIEEHVPELIDQVQQESKQYDTNSFLEKQIPDEELFQKIEKMGTHLSNYSKTIAVLRWKFLRYHGKEIKIKEGNWLYKKMDLKGKYLISRVNVESPDRHKRLMDFFVKFFDEGEKLIQAFKEEDRVMFEKTGRNPDSIAEGKKFFFVTCMFLPMMIEELA